VAEVRRVAAAPTGPDALLVIRNRDQTTVLTGVAQERVRAFHQTLLGELGHAVTNHTIPLHLTETQAAFPGSPLGRLTGQHHERT